MMRYFVVFTAVVLSTIILSTIGSAAAWGQVGSTVGGATGAATGRLSGGVDLQRRSGVRIPASSRSAASRVAGPNFSPNRVGVNVGVGAGANINSSVGRAQMGASTSASGSVRVGRERRRRQSPSDANRNRRSRRSENETESGNQDSSNPGADDAQATGENEDRSRQNEAHQTMLLQADLHLASRLAEIDRLRDHALANGDVNLLARADALEAEARNQHQFRVRQATVVSAEYRRRAAQAFAEGEFHGEAAGALSAPPQTQNSAYQSPPNSQGLFAGQFAGQFEGQAAANGDGQSEYWREEAQARAQGAMNRSRRAAAYGAEYGAQAQGQAYGAAQAAARTPGHANFQGQTQFQEETEFQRRMDFPGNAEFHRLPPPYSQIQAPAIPARNPHYDVETQSFIHGNVVAGERAPTNRQFNADFNQQTEFSAQNARSAGRTAARGQVMTDGRLNAAYRRSPQQGPPQNEAAEPAPDEAPQQSNTAPAAGEDQ